MADYRFFDRLLLRVPYYSFSRYAPDRLPEVLQQKVFQRALMLASPPFYEVVSAAGFRYHVLTQKQRFTLLRYYNRMCFRPVPFGAFASFSLVEWSADRVLLDGQEVLHLAGDREEEQEEDDRESDADALLGCSVLVYRLEREFRVMRRELPGKRGQYVFSIEAVAAAPLTTRLLSLLRRQPLRRSELTELIVSWSGCKAEEAGELLDFLLAEQVLKRHWPERSLTAGLKSIYTVPAPGRSYYAVLERGATGGPSFEDRGELLRGISALQAISAALYAPSVDLERFRVAFLARFDLQRVPLLEALDPDTGVVYGGNEKVSAGNWTAVHRLLLHRWIQDRSRGYYDEVSLSESDISGLGASAVSFPNTTAVLFRRSDDRLLIEHAGGVTATALTGRFSLFSEGVLSLCKEVVAAEARANPGIIFADVIAESGPHVDNINRRAKIYGYEIRLSGCYEQDDGVLLPDDLFLSVRNGELLLESGMSGQRVVPRLATAFNYRHSGLAVFKMLCDLAYQGLCTRLGFEPEHLFPGLAFYPRITYGQCILSAAKWLFRVAELPHDFSGMRAFRDRFRLPQLVTTGKGDRQLVFDLSDPAETAFLLDHLRDEEQVTLTEYLLPDRSVRCGHREMAGQFLGLLYHGTQVYRPFTSVKRPTPGRVRRSFPPGSEWLYLKFYAAEASADRVLLELVASLLRRHRKLIKDWFFVRYTDPDPHIRLRMRTAEPGRLAATLEQLVRETGRGFVRSLKADTYERELERYGAERIALAEAVFGAGSELTLAALKAGISGMPFAVLTVLRMLWAFFKEPEEAILLAVRSVDGFRKEFGGGKAERLELDREYRLLRPELLALIAGKPLRDRFAALDRSVKAFRMATGQEPEERLRLAADLCHMQVNRSFASDQRRREMAVWVFVQKYLEGEAARKRKLI